MGLMNLLKFQFLKNNMKKGFTLIELLIVVAIIGILAGVGIPMYNGYMTTAKITASKANHISVQNYITAIFMRCAAGATVIYLPGLPKYRDISCTSSPAGMDGTFQIYFRSAGFENPYDDSYGVTADKSFTPPLGSTYIYGDYAKTMYVTTNIGTKTGSNDYLKSELIKE